MTLDKMRPFPVAVQGATEDPSNPFRERIALRCAEADAAYPRGVELEARALCAMHEVIHGSATQLRGLHSPQRFRDALMGVKNFPLADLCRLATEPTRESRAAVKAVIQELAASIGLRLEPINVNAPDAFAALAGLMETGTAFAAQSVTALGDGVIEPHEARALRPELEALKQRVVQWDGILTEVEKGGAE